MMRLTDTFWRQIEPVYDAILVHPFIAELTDGTLARDRFVFYMKQDALYLQDFARALAIAGARLDDLSQVQAFLDFARGAIVVERALHESYFDQFGVSLDIGPSPACFAYTRYLLAEAALAPAAEAIAALLPCFWIYREVGREIVRRSEAGLANNRYARWIETYAGEDFSRSVDHAIDITEALAAAAPPAGHPRLAEAFDRSARLEWLFWDSAYRQEQWPP